ncbi:hypothetical protein [Microbacterium sp. F2]|uniref:hypothetical protein n=1 Tax=Microbacterium sp. F2 TaxID=3422228 RepID=UPI003FD36B0A
MAIGIAVTLPGMFTRNIDVEFVTRGNDSGDGLAVLAWWCLPVAVSVGVVFRHWGSKSLAFISIAAALLLVVSGVRSPLLLIAIAFIPRGVKALGRSRSPALSLLAISLSLYLLLGVAGGISRWRGSIRAGLPESLIDSTLLSLSNPYVALTSSGIESLDGLMFVQVLDAAPFHPSILDPLKAFLTLIPRQIYPGKPDFLSNEISSALLNFGTAGMFLSGPGYALVISGSLLGAILLFMVGGFTFRAVFSPRFGGVVGTIATYTLLRFIMGGDAFDFYQGMTLLLIVTVGLFVGRFLRLVNSGLSRQTTRIARRSG